MCLTNSHHSVLLLASSSFTHSLAICMASRDVLYYISSVFYNERSNFSNIYLGMLYMMMNTQ